MRVLRRFPAIAGVALLALAPLARAGAQGTAAPGADAAARATMAAADKGRIMGSDAAPIWVVIFSDFQCPFCKRWHDDTDARLRRDYVQTGKVKVAFLNFPLSSHKHAVPMAEAAMCASAQGKFWAFHDGVFATQPQWSALADVGLTIEAAAKQAGVDEAAFKTCRSARQTKLLVEEDQRRGASAGVGGTPAFFIGTQAASGAIPSAQFFQIVESELAKAKGAKP